MALLQNKIYTESGFSLSRQMKREAHLERKVALGKTVCSLPSSTCVRNCVIQAKQVVSGSEVNQKLLNVEQWSLH